MGTTSPCPGGPHQGALQVEGLGVLAQQHDILLQVVETAVLVVADALLWVVGEAALPQDPASCLGTLKLGIPLTSSQPSLQLLCIDSEAQNH